MQKHSQDRKKPTVYAVRGTNLAARCNQYPRAPAPILAMPSMMLPPPPARVGKALTGPRAPGPGMPENLPGGWSMLIGLGRPLAVAPRPLGACLAGICCCCGGGRAGGW